MCPTHHGHKAALVLGGRVEQHVVAAQVACTRKGTGEGYSQAWLTGSSKPAG